ncbi:MAG: MFS transporter [Sphaerochaetaceae bacterium]|nr:MFS transporter [Sphaerochaetaceae bacterium]
MDMKEKRVQFWGLNTASFLAQLGFSTVNLALVYYLRYCLNASATLIGLAAGTYTVTYLLGCIFFSPVVRRFRPRHTIEAAMIGISVCFLLIVNTNSIPLIFLLLGIYGFLLCFQWPQMETWISRDTEGKELSFKLSSFNFSWCFGISISALSGSYLVTIDPRYGFYFSILVLLAVYLIIFFISALFPAIRSVDAESKHVKKLVEESVDRSTPLRYDSWCAIFLVYTALSVILNIFPLYAKEGMMIKESVSGSLLLFRGLATCFSFIFFGATTFWTFKAWLIYLCEAIFVLLCIVFAFSSSVIGIGIFFVLFGILFSICYNFSIFHSAVGAINKGKRMVIHECMISIGQIIGSSVGGSIYQNMGWSRVLLTLGGIGVLFLSIQLFFYFLGKKRKEEKV